MIIKKLCIAYILAIATLSVTACKNAEDRTETQNLEQTDSLRNNVLDQANDSDGFLNDTNPTPNKDSVDVR
ncbi:MAG: hypothetical protein SGJ04_07610 [Bacteroidota bacterium]|nr:hypothetical protein [Bacteroidota bacterium]